ncbi:MAG: hypothetical protein ACYC6L_08845 [Anaerolineae bacterium]
MSTNLHQLPLNAAVAQGEPPNTEVILRDPRPELADDHAIWERLLALAHQVHGAQDPESLFWVLHGLRCLGCELVRESYGWRIAAGENADYAFHRQRYLVNRKEQVLALLTQLNEAV